MNTITATTHDVVFKAVEPVQVAAVRGLVPNVMQVGDTFDRLFGLLEEYVQRHGAAAGPPMAIYHDPGTGPQMVDMHVELAVPFEGASVKDEQVHVYDLPGVQRMACLVYRGPFEEISGAYNALKSWIEKNGYRVTGPSREIYLSCGSGDSSGYVTEVQFPVEG